MDLQQVGSHILQSPVHVNHQVYTLRNNLSKQHQQRNQYLDRESRFISLGSEMVFQNKTLAKTAFKYWEMLTARITLGSQTENLVPHSHKACASYCHVQESWARKMLTGICRQCVRRRGITGTTLLYVSIKIPDNWHISVASTAIHVHQGIFLEPSNI